MAIPNGKAPDLLHRLNLASVLRAAVVPDTSDATYGVVWGEWIANPPVHIGQDLPATWKFQWKTNGAWVDFTIDAGMGFDITHDPRDIFYLSTTMKGETTVSDWISTDYCRTWNRIA